MISRHHLRIKALQSFYSFSKTGDKSLQVGEKELLFSIEKMHELYFSLFLLPGEVSRLAYKKMEIRRNKLSATAEDLNPNMKFLDNKVIQIIEESEELAQYLQEKKIGWGNYPELIKKLHDTLTESEYFAEYMASDDTSFKRDKDIVKFFFTDVLFNSEDLFQTLEEKSIFWLDDVDFIIGMIVKTLKNIKKNNPETLRFFPLYQNDDDKEFVKTLFRKSLINKKEYLDLIDKNVANWDIDRIALTDKLILILALCEIIEFPSIPVKVSFNEYIEIAKKYGTEKSGSFVNGVLDKLIEKLKAEGKIVKTGRGLIDN